MKEVDKLMDELVDKHGHSREGLLIITETLTEEEKVILFNGLIGRKKRKVKNKILKRD